MHEHACVAGSPFNRVDQYVSYMFWRLSHSTYAHIELGNGVKARQNMQLSFRSISFRAGRVCKNPAHAHQVDAGHLSALFVCFHHCTAKRIDAN